MVRHKRMRGYLLAIAIVQSAMAGTPDSQVVPLLPERLRTSEGAIGAVVLCVAQQADGPLVAAGGDDHLVRIWNRDTASLVGIWKGHRDWVQAIQFLGERELLSAGRDGQILAWRLDAMESPRRIAKRNGPVADLALDVRRGWLAAAGLPAGVDLFSAGTGEWVPQATLGQAESHAVAIGPEAIATCRRCGPVRLWSVKADSQAPRFLGASTSRFRALAFSWDGRSLAAAGDRSIELFDVVSGERIREVPTQQSRVFALTFVAPERIAVAGSDNCIHVWDLGLGRRLRTLSGHTGSVTSLDYQRRVLVSGSYDTTIRFWTDPLFESKLRSTASTDEVAQQTP